MLTCRNDFRYHLSELQNMEFELNFCFEHAERTCCTVQDTTKIRLKYENARMRNQDSEAVSRECLSAVNDALCYYCDSDIVSIVQTDFYCRALVYLMASVLTTAVTCSNYVKTRLLTQLWMPKKPFLFVNQTQWFARNCPLTLRHLNSFAKRCLSQFQLDTCPSLMQKRLEMNKKMTLLTALMEEPTLEKSTKSSSESLWWMRNQIKNLPKTKRLNWQMC